MFGYIYLTTNLLNGKKYIGKHKASIFNEEYLGSGKIIRQAVLKNGRENFTVKCLHECETEEELNELEKFYIKKYNAQEDSNFYNISEGGENGRAMLGKHQSDYQKEKASQVHKGRTRSQETRERIKAGIQNMSEEKKLLRQQHASDSHKGKKHTEEQKERISNTLKQLYAEGKIVNGCLGKPAWNKGKKMTEEQLKNHHYSKGMIGIYYPEGDNNNKVKMVPPEQLEEWLALGWKKGYGRRNRKDEER